MTTDHKPLALLAELLIKQGLTHVVHSPGSRNAPIIIAFSSYGELTIESVVDERSAAYYALGLALASKRPVVIECTSGTAALNYAPAIAEAYYQKIPLLILTADRSAKHIGIGDGQTIDQRNVYSNYIKKSYTLPEKWNDPADREVTKGIALEAWSHALYEEPGPVHINIPLDEPLYGTDQNPDTSDIIAQSKAVDDLPDLTDFRDAYRNSKKILILAGQQPRSEETEVLLGNLSNSHVVIMTETTTNIWHPDFIDGIDNTVTGIRAEEVKDYRPDLLITVGGAIVSKMVKAFFRKYPPGAHWHISPDGIPLDTFFCLTSTLRGEPAAILGSMPAINIPDDYQRAWLSRKIRAQRILDQMISEIGFTDLWVMHYLFNKLGAGYHLHLGNSTPVRYAQLMGSKEGVISFSNRGVSGIDGQISTAAGIATIINTQPHLLITGDLGYLYDSNGLLLARKHPQLKIILINNGGGGIFRFIGGPDTVPDFTEYFEVKPEVDFELINQGYGLRTCVADSMDSLTKCWEEFILPHSPYHVLEIRTPAEENGTLLRTYFKRLADNETYK